MPREETLSLNGTSHRLLTWEGPEGAPTVVLVHGYLDLAWSFAPFAEALQRRMSATLVAPDLRGHGASARVAEGGYYHFPDYVSDLFDLVSPIPGRRFLLGHSMGGGIASLLCGAFPELVEKLVLIEGLGPPRERPETPPERMRRWITEVRERRRRPPRPMPSLADAARRLREANPRLSNELSTMLAEKGTRAVEGGFVWAYDPLHRTVSPFPASAETHRSFLRRIACPTLLIEGADSPFRAWIDDDRETDIARRENVVIPDAGHMVQQDQPERLAEAVARFLLA